MKIAVIFFTENGKRIADSLSHDLQCDTFDGRNREKGALKKFVGQCFSDHTALVFISAAGIAVRLSADFIKDKTSDIPVLIMDERAYHVIPILSGHLGGANELAYRIAEITGAVPVITTATDLNDTFAADVYAKRHNLGIINASETAFVSSVSLKMKMHSDAGPVTASADISEKILQQYVTILSAAQLADAVKAAGCDPYAFYQNGRFPDQITEYLNEKYGNEMNNQTLDQTSEQTADKNQDASDCKKNKRLFLYRRNLAVGIGCWRGKPEKDIYHFMMRVFHEHKLWPWAVKSFNSIDLKKDEQGIISLAGRFAVPFYTYSADELMSIKGDFESSDFVMKTTGCDNVCERAAKAGAPDGRCLLKKTAGDGVTIAVYETS